MNVFFVQLLHDDLLHTVLGIESVPGFLLQEIKIITRRTITIKPRAKHGLDVVAGFREASIPRPFESSLRVLARHQEIKLPGLKSYSKNAHREDKNIAYSEQPRIPA